MQKQRTKKSRIIPLNKTAYEILDRNIKKRKPELGKIYRGKSSISDDLIFVSSLGDAYNRTGFSSSLGYCIEKAKKAGMNLTVQDFQRIFSDIRLQHVV